MLKHLVDFGIHFGEDGRVFAAVWCLHGDKVYSMLMPRFSRNRLMANHGDRRAEDRLRYLLWGNAIQGKEEVYVSSFAGVYVMLQEKDWCYFRARSSKLEERSTISQPTCE